MPHWIKYDGRKPDTYPKESRCYRIKRDGEFGQATFNVGWGWAHLKKVPDYWLDETDNKPVEPTDSRSSPIGRR